jgi:hypothetical protein
MACAAPTSAMSFTFAASAVMADYGTPFGGKTDRGFRLAMWRGKQAIEICSFTLALPAFGMNFTFAGLIMKAAFGIRFAVKTDLGLHSATSRVRQEIVVDFGGSELLKLRASSKSAASRAHDS